MLKVVIYYEDVENLNEAVRIEDLLLAAGVEDIGLKQVKICEKEME